MTIRHIIPGAVLVLAAHLAAAEQPADQGSTPAKPVEFVEGCLAKIYPATSWPIEELPDAPGETLMLSKVPDVQPSADTKNGGNLLVESKLGILDDIRYYAVVFDGYLEAKEEGRYGITVQSDDPFQVFIEGQELKGLKSDYFVPFEDKVNMAFPVADQKWATATDAVLLGKGRYYRIQIICKQRHLGPAKLGGYMKENWGFTGAKFRAMETTPSGESVLLKLFLVKP